jgi:hypothetical protein
VLSVGQHYNITDTDPAFDQLERTSRLGFSLAIFGKSVMYRDNDRRVGLRFFYQWSTFIPNEAQRANLYSWEETKFSITGITISGQQRVWKNKRITMLIGLAGGAVFYLEHDLCKNSSEICLNLPSGGGVVQPGVYLLFPVYGELGIQLDINPTLILTKGDTFPYEWGLQLYAGIVAEKGGVEDE